MKTVQLLLLASVVASCTNAPPPMTARTPQEQSQLAALIAGKVPGRPLNCLPSYQSNDMVVVDDNTIAFRAGSRVYVNHMQSGCVNIDHGRNALVTKTTGSGLCRGDIGQVLDTGARITVGSCVFGDFIPYTKARG